MFIQNYVIFLPEILYYKLFYIILQPKDCKFKNYYDEKD